MQKLIESYYFNPQKAGSFTSPSKLLESLNSNERMPNVKLKDLKNTLRKYDSYTLHKPVRRNFKRSKILTKGLNDMYEADLMDMSNISKSNSGINFILVLIDAFSRKLWVEPLKSKNAKEVLLAFEKLIQLAGKPRRIRTDAGGEFKNKLLQNYFNKNKIEHYIGHSEAKASIAERVIRTLKKKIYKYLTHKETNKYINALDDLVNSYNKTYHRALKTSPDKVQPQNEKKIWKRLYLPTLTKAPKPNNLSKGDKVRISKLRSAFPKGYLQGWTDEFFNIHKVIKSIPYRYLLKDLAGEEIEGSFYEAELEKVDKEEDAEYLIEEIKKARGKGKNREYFVKFKGWPEKFNSWVKAKDVKDIQ